MCSSIDETLDLVAAKILFAPYGFLGTSNIELEEMCNGCGAANAKFDFVPDTIYGLCIGAVCNIHDFMFNKGETLEDMQEANRVMLNNLLRLIERVAGWKKYLKPLMRRRALKMYEAVNAFGGPAFWEGKNEKTTN